MLIQPSDAALIELQVYKRADGKDDWRLVVNDDIVATSGGQGYENPSEALDMGIKVTGGAYANITIKIVGPLEREDQI